MGWLTSKPTAPNTISDTQWADLRHRAQKVAPPTFSPQAVKQRFAARAQQVKADQN